MSELPSAAPPDYEQMRRDRGWPTPIAMRRTADALDSLTPAKYGDVLRWFADLADAVLSPPALAQPTPVVCVGHCGFLDWTLTEYGHITHKHGCPRRTTSFCQTHRDGCPQPEDRPVPDGLLREALEAHEYEGQYPAGGPECACGWVGVFEPHTAQRQWRKHRYEAILAALAAQPEDRPRPPQEARAVERAKTWPALHFVHQPGCGEKSEFPWECDCHYSAHLAEVEAALHPAEPGDER